MADKWPSVLVTCEPDFKHRSPSVKAWYKKYCSLPAPAFPGGGATSGRAGGGGVSFLTLPEQQPCWPQPAAPGREQPRSAPASSCSYGYGLCVCGHSTAWWHCSPRSSSLREVKGAVSTAKSTLHLASPGWGGCRNAARGHPWEQPRCFPASVAAEAACSVTASLQSWKRTKAVQDANLVISEFKKIYVAFNYKGNVINFRYLTREVFNMYHVPTWHMQGTAWGSGPQLL